MGCVWGITRTSGRTASARTASANMAAMSADLKETSAKLDLIPAVMLGGSFSNMEILNNFLAGPYHGPDDEVGPGLVLDGAAEDANLLVARCARGAAIAPGRQMTPCASTLQLPFDAVCE